MNTIKIYQPKSYTNFKCTMNGCKNNCCQNWRIDIDELTYNKYIALEDEPKNEILKYIGYQGDDKSKKYIKLAPNGDCPFLNENRLCTLQIKFGYDYLCRTCRIYPRIACYVGNSPEYFIELSCEASVNHVLFDKTPVYFEEIELDIDIYKNTALDFTYVLETTKYTEVPNGYDIFWKLRVASVMVLQYRKYSIRFRMLLLCMFIQDAAALFAAREDSKVITLADDFMNKLEQGFYNELYASVPRGVERDFNIVLDVLKEIYGKNRMFISVMDEVIKGLEIEPGNWKLSDGFVEKYLKYYNLYLAKNEYILENYLVYRILFEGFPFNYKIKNDIMSNYVELFAKFNLIEFIITGICRHNMKFDKRHICIAVSLYSRGYEHSPTKFFQT